MGEGIYTEEWTGQAGRFGFSAEHPVSGEMSPVMPTEAEAIAWALSAPDREEAAGSY